jgi:hypothetical protein
MAKAVTADAAKDALKHYEEIFEQAGWTTPRTAWTRCAISSC